MLKPRIFVSSVSRELGSARQLVANTLTAIDYEPVWQDIFLTEGGDLRKMLRDTIDDCSAVIQLVGDAYGAEPPTIDHLFGRISYTQYEALYAEKQNKKVYYLFLDNKFPKDNPVEAVDKLPGEETDEKFKERQFLQATYKERIRASGHLRSKSSSSSELESSILKLRNDLRQYRRNTKLLFAGIFAAIAIVLGGIAWVNFKQDDQSKEIGKLTAAQAKALEDQAKLLDSQKQQISAVNLKQEQLLEILRELPKVMAKPDEGKKDATPQQTVDNAYEKLEKKYDIKEGTLEKKLTDFSKDIKSNSGVPPLDRANAFYVAKQYAEAEKFALEAKDLALKEGDKVKAVEALIVAGNAALSQTTNQRAVEYFKTANELTDPAKDFDQWAKIRRYFANQLLNLDRAKEALKVLEESRDAIFRKYGADDVRTMDYNLSLATAYRMVNNFTQAYSLFKDVYEKRLAKHGANDRETLYAKYRFGSLMRIMLKLDDSRKLLEETFEAQKKQLGEKDADTLETMNILALTYSDLNLSEKSINLFKQLLNLRIEIGGEKHENTLFVAGNLVNTMITFNLSTEAVPIAEKYYEIAKLAFGPDSTITTTAMSNVAGAYFNAGRVKDAIKIDEELLATRERTLGADHNETIRTISLLAGDYSKDEQYDKAISLYEKAIGLASKKLGPDDALTLSLMSSLAATYTSKNQIDLAKNLLESVYPSQKSALGFDNSDTRTSLGRLRSVYLKLDELDKAVALYRKDLDLTTEKNGPESTATINRTYELAATYEFFKKPELAAPFYDSVAKFRTKVLGADHNDTIAALKKLEEVYKSSQQYDKAINTSEELVKTLTKKFSADHDETIAAIKKIEESYRWSRQFDKAIEKADTLIEMFTKKFGPEDRMTTGMMYTKALNYENNREYEKAIPIYENVRAIEKKTYSPDDPDRISTLDRLVVSYVQAKQIDKAVPIFNEIVESERRRLGADNKELVTRIYGFALNQFDSKNYLDTAATISEAIQVERDRKVGSRPSYMAFLIDLKGVSLCKAGKYNDALPLLKEVLEIRKANPAEKWYVPDAESAYGGALTGVKKFAEAEPLLLSGYNGLKAQFSAMPDYEQYRLADAIERLIDFYTATNKSSEVTKWKATLEEHKKTQAAKTTAAK